MKLNNTNGVCRNQSFGSAFKKVCLESCAHVVAQIKKVRNDIFTESRDTLQAHQHLIQLALNEAEALALQTTYPHLLFPTLAMEKVQAVARWNEHQQAVRRIHVNPALAA